MSDKPDKRASSGYSFSASAASACDVAVALEPGDRQPGYLVNWRRTGGFRRKRGDLPELP
jgi:hypothetical protein